MSDRPTDFEFMSPSDWIEFTCELHDVVGDLDADVLVVESRFVRMHRGASIDLLPLAQECCLNDHDEWRDIIVDRLIDQIERLDAIAHRSPGALSMIDLRVRLVADDPADHALFGALGARPFAEGITQVLAVDEDDGVRSVAEKEIDDAGWDLDETWASAWAQTRALEQPDEINLVEVGGADVIHVFAERPFVTSLVDVLDELIGPICRNGTLVSLPHAHSLIVHPIVDDSVFVAIEAMIPITRQLHRQGPSSLSPHLYWYVDGELRCVPTYFGRDGVEAYPPPQLHSLIQRLG